jgi:hypothetical protein
MNNYFGNNDRYFETPKTESIKAHGSSISESITKVAEKLVDPRYNTRKPSLTILGYVKK